MDFEVGDYVIVTTRFPNIAGSVGVVARGVSEAKEYSRVLVRWTRFAGPDGYRWARGAEYNITAKNTRKITEDEYTAQLVRLRFLEATGAT